MHGPASLRPAVLLVLALALVAGGCGGGDDEVASDETATTLDEGTTTTSGEDGAATTTTGDEADVDEGDEGDEGSQDEGEGAEDTIALPATGDDGDRAAAAGLLVLADLGEGWTEYLAAAPVTGDEPEEVGRRSRVGCAFGPGGADPAAVVGFADGAIFQRGEATRFTSSFALAHADESAAQATVEAFRSAAWSACLVERKTDEAVEEDPTTSWRADPVEDEGRGQGGFEGVVYFQFQAEIDGELRDANGFETDLLYRVGTVVLVVAVEGVAQEGDPTDLDQKTSDEVYAATLLALGRLGL